MIELPFGQTFDGSDLALIALLTVLEGVLSIDNALVLGILARRLPKIQQGRALSYGLVGAFVFRFIAIATAQYLLRWLIVKLLGGVYLLFVSIKYFVFDREDEETGPGGEHAAGDGAPAHGHGHEYAKFGPTVAVIALTDVAFAVDSIMSAIALVGGKAHDTGVHPKLWVVVTGGLLGVLLMRYAAVLFIKLLTKFPRFEVAAYVLVCIIGIKLAVDWATEYFHFGKEYVDFHDWKTPGFWAFWIAMIVAFCTGFLPEKKRSAGAPVAAPPAAGSEGKQA